MNIVDWPELANETYEWLVSRVWEMNQPSRSAGIHLTELIYCLTGSYWDRIMPLPYSRESAVTMALGIALERLLIPLDKRAKAGTKDGVDYSPDFWFRGDTPAELKTTRMSTKKTYTRDFPETWRQQIMGYCYAENKTEYGLSIIHLLGNYKPPFPEILAVKFFFTEKELKDNWEYLMWRKAAYIQSFADQKPLPAGRWCMNWECKNCKYAKSQIHCGLVVK